MQRREAWADWGRPSGPARLSSLTLPSVTTTRTKVADIAVTDDALGTNTTTLSGADAASFEVVGNALYLKAGVALQYSSKSQYK